MDGLPPFIGNAKIFMKKGSEFEQAPQAPRQPRNQPAQQQAPQNQNPYSRFDTPEEQTQDDLPF